MTPNPFARSLSRLLALCGLATLAGVAGCVERKITIASNPPGALVYVNDVEMGRTPVTFPFLWYGNYDVRLRVEKPEGAADDPKAKQYYLHTSKQAYAPVYQWLGIDLFAEVLPLKFKDEKVWAFEIPEIKEPGDAELIQRAKELQGRIEETPELAKKGDPKATIKPK